MQLTHGWRTTGGRNGFAVAGGGSGALFTALAALGGGVVGCQGSTAAGFGAGGPGEAGKLALLLLLVVKQVFGGLFDALGFVLSPCASGSSSEFVRMRLILAACRGCSRIILAYSAWNALVTSS